MSFYVCRNKKSDLSQALEEFRVYGSHADDRISILVKPFVAETPTTSGKIEITDQTNGESSTFHAEEPNLTLDQLNRVRINEHVVAYQLPAATTKKRSVPIIAFDCSSSMRDNAGQECVYALNHVLKQYPGHLVAYNGTAFYYGLISKVEAIGFDCGTVFNAAYQGILHVLQTAYHPGDKVDIIFFTDGRDYGVFSTDHSAMSNEDLKRFGDKLVDYEVTIHAIGIERRSDTRLLLGLNKLGTQQGTYGLFAKNVKDSHIEEADRLMEILGTSETITIGETKVRLGSQPTTYFSEEPLADGEVVDTASIPFATEVDYCAWQFQRLISNVDNIELKHVMAARQYATGLFSRAGVDKDTRKIQRPRIMELMSSLQGLSERLEKGLKIDNASLASLNVKARNMRGGDKHIQRKAAERAIMNAGKEPATDAKIKKLKKEFKAMKVEDLEAEYSWLDEGGDHIDANLNCVLTMDSPAELLQDGSCITIGLGVKTDATAIMDPRRVKITHISTYLLSAVSAFDGATLRSIKAGAPGIVRDASDKQITGFIPLWLSDNHGKMMECWLYRCIGYLVANDPLQGTAKHAVYLYLAAYRKCLEYDGEFYENLSVRILDTLKFLHNRYPNILCSPEKFASNVNNRMPDQTLCLEAIMDLWMLLYGDDEIAKAKGYWWEEKLRREFKDKKHQQWKDYPAQSLFNINGKVWVQPSIRAITGKGSVVDANLRTFYNKHEHLLDEEGRELLAEKLGIPDPRLEQALEEKRTRNPSGVQSSSKSEIIPTSRYELDIVLPQGLAKYFEGLDLNERQIAYILLGTRMEFSAVEHAKHYTDVFRLTDEELCKYLKGNAREAIRSLRRNAVGALKSTYRFDESKQMLDAYPDAGIVARIAILNASCYVGRNITSFIPFMEKKEELQAILYGEADLGRLLGLNQSVIISTVCDSKNYRMEEGRGGYFWFPGLESIAEYRSAFIQLGAPRASHCTIQTWLAKKFPGKGKEAGSSSEESSDESGDE